MTKEDEILNQVRAAQERLRIALEALETAEEGGSDLALLLLLLRHDLTDAQDSLEQAKHHLLFLVSDKTQETLALKESHAPTSPAEEEAPVIRFQRRETRALTAPFALGNEGA